MCTSKFNDHRLSGLASTLLCGRPNIAFGSWVVRWRRKWAAVSERFRSS